MVVFFFRAAVETFVAAWMSKSVSLSSSSLPPTTKIKFWEFLGKPHNFEGKKTFWHFFLEKLIWNNEKEFQYDWKHRDATRPCFFCGLFCGWIKKRCQRQIIYFSRRSVIKVFAPTPQTAFLRSPITVEIIIIGQQASPGLLSMTRKNAKQDMSQLCGKCCQAGEFENHLDQSGLLSASLGTSKKCRRMTTWRLWYGYMASLEKSLESMKLWISWLTTDGTSGRWKAGIWMKLNKIYPLLGCYTLTWPSHATAKVVRWRTMRIMICLHSIKDYFCSFLR